MVNKLLLQFLDKAKSLKAEVSPIKVLKSNTFKIDRANILVRTASDLGRRFFFGLNYINAEEIYNLDNSFIAFLCGNVEKAVIIPSDVLISHLPEISHDRNGEYKINFTKDLNLVLKGRNNQLVCKEFINNWESLTKSAQSKISSMPAEESIYNVIQGRLIEIGNIRGFSTYCPDKSKTFNKKKLGDYSTLQECPKLQYSDYDLL